MLDSSATRGKRSLATNLTRGRRACHPEQGAMLVSTSPLSSSERRSYEEMTRPQTSAPDWIGTPPTVTSVNPGSGSTLLPSGRVLARAFDGYVF
jgi:hypothetical protein